MSSGYEVGTAARLQAYHRIPWLPGPEGELHAHDYKIELVVERAALDPQGMVVDLDVLNEAVASVVARLSGADLEAIRPPGAEAVTVEILARWVHGEVAEAVRQGGGEVLTVRVWESETAFGGYRASVWEERRQSAAETSSS